MRVSIVQCAVFAASISIPSIGVADDWLATKVRGQVMQAVNGTWEPLHRGDVVPDDRRVQTMKGARITLERGNEIIELSGPTQVRIVDRPGRSFTTVKQDFGKVSVQADVREVQHFAVETPHLAAVVKGTKFTVISGAHAAEVSVQRGHVAVEDADTGQTTLLAAGQSASTEDGDGPLIVEGHGKSPVIFGEDGKPLAVPGRGKGSENGNGPEKAGTAGENGNRPERGHGGGNADHGSGGSGSGSENSGGGGGGGSSGGGNGGGNGNGRG